MLVAVSGSPHQGYEQLSELAGRLLLQQDRHAPMQLRSWIKKLQPQTFELQLSGGSPDIKLRPTNTKSFHNL